MKIWLKSEFSEKFWLSYPDMISYLGITNQQPASQYQLALPSSKVKVWIQPKDNSIRNEKHCTLEGTPSDVILDVF